MIKVLQLNGRPRVIQCPSCNAILHYEIFDIHWDEYGKQDFIGCPLCDEAIFYCPVCGKLIIFSKGELVC